MTYYTCQDANCVELATGEFDESTCRNLCGKYTCATTAPFGCVMYSAGMDLSLTYVSSKDECTCTRWECKNGKCIENSNGEHFSENECTAACGPSYICNGMSCTEAPENTTDTTYPYTTSCLEACSSRYACLPDPNGGKQNTCQELKYGASNYDEGFQTVGECKQRCKQATMKYVVEGEECLAKPSVEIGKQQSYSSEYECVRSNFYYGCTSNGTC